MAELGYAFDTLGADGVIVETNAHGVYLGDQRLEPVFAELARRRATVLVHPTSPPCWQQTALGRPRPMIEFIFDTARAVTGLILAGTLTRHPGMNIIVPHGGGALPLLADRIKAFLSASPSLHDPAPDPVAQLRRLYYDLAGTRSPARFPRYSAWSAPASCCTAATSASPQRSASRGKSRPSTQPRYQSRTPPGSRRRVHHRGEAAGLESPLVKARCPGKAAAEQVAGNMQVKEVRIPDATDRLVICYNPDAAERDAAIRAGLISKLGELIAGTDKLTVTRRAELRGKISTMPGLSRFLRVTPGGLLRTGKAKAKAEENLDGKYLLRCADPQLSAEDIAVGYKQLLEVERGWRDMKSVLDLRPVYHRLEERIRAHVLLCWLALLLVRVAENTTGTTWPQMRRELDRIHLGTFTGPAGTFKQCTELSKPARDLLARLSIDAPRKIHELTTGT